MQLAHQNLSVFICYESAFPDEIRGFVNNGAQLLVNISNDGWFGHTAAPYQHLNQARMRAIENRRWLLRDTNTGITSVIDPYGRVVQSIRPDNRNALDAMYSTESATTFYTRHGDWFAYACAIISLLAIVLGALRKPA
jgi:apolipoprotein N-acyltransferase